MSGRIGIGGDNSNTYHIRFDKINCSDNNDNINVDITKLWTIGEFNLNKSFFQTRDGKYCEDLFE